MPGRNTSTRVDLISFDPQAIEARIARAGGQPTLVVLLKDERVLVMPLWLYPTLLAAPARQRKELELIAGGRGVRWPSLDLDISIRSMLHGYPDITRSGRSTAKALALRQYARLLATLSPPTESTKRELNNRFVTSAFEKKA